MSSRRRFLQHAGLGGIVAAGVAPGVVGARPAMRWRLASSFPKSLDILHGCTERFARNVSEATDGRFTISIYAAGELVPPFSVLDAVGNGTVDCGHTAAYYYFGKDEAFSFDCAIPFGMNSRQQTAWMFDGNGLALLRELYADHGVVNFVMGNSGTQMGGWYRRPVRSLDDLKDLRVRIGGFGGMVFERLGVLTQNIPLSDAYPALEKGTIDATEFIGPYDDLKLGLHRVAPHYHYPAWWEGSGQLSLYVGTEAWNALPAEYKSIVERAASDAHVLMQARYDARNPAAMKRLLGEGARLAPFPREVLDAAFAASQYIYTDLDARNPRWRRIHADYRRFLADQVQWHATAEAHYNAYMRTLDL